MNDSPTLVHAVWCHYLRKHTLPALFVPANGSKPMRSMTWGEFGARVAFTMSVLKNDLAIRPGDRVAIVSWGCPQWLISAIAIWSIGAVVVGIDPRYQRERVDFVLNDSDSASDQSRTGAVLVGDDIDTSALDFGARPVLMLGQLYSMFREKNHANSLSPHAEFADNLLKHVSAAGCIDQEIEVNPHSLCMLLYTSGSSGSPKGVCISHHNLAFMSRSLAALAKISAEDVFLAQLPLSHIFIWNGIGPCLYSATPIFVCHPLEMGKYLKIVRPTILFGVPKVWHSLAARAIDKLGEPVVLSLAERNKAVDWLSRNLTQAKRLIVKRAQNRSKRVGDNFARRLVARAMKGSLGGRLRLLVSGGAALPTSTRSFFSQFDLPIYQGYGATETTGCVCVETPETAREGSVGKLIDGISVKFTPVADGDQIGRGVMSVFGASVASGYWNQPEKNQAAFGSGGFDTGDVIRLDDEGFLYVEGRAEDDGKLVNGEKVSAPEIEALFPGSGIIRYLIPVFENRPRVAAIVFLNELVTRELLREQGISEPEGNFNSFAAALPVVRYRVADEIKAVNQHFLSTGERWKQVRHFEIADQQPTTDNGMQTIKFEISRVTVAAHYAALIEKMYAEEIDLMKT